jgi:hypothetical protein
LAVDAVVSSVESVLMDIGFHDRVGLNIHGIPTAVGLDAKGEVSVGINVPEKATEEPKSAISVAECGISYSSPPSNQHSRFPRVMHGGRHTSPFNAPVRWQLGGDTPMETRMCRGIRCRVCGFKVQVRRAESADYAVGHRLAAFDFGCIFKVQEDVGLGRGMKGFSVPSWRL